MTATAQDIPAMIEQLRKLLEKRNGKVGLTIEDDAYVAEGDWIYLILKPAEPDVRAIDYVERLDELEAELRQETGHENILLVPAAPG